MYTVFCCSFVLKGPEGMQANCYGNRDGER